jgi:hypothetical protein
MREINQVLRRKETVKPSVPCFGKTMARLAQSGTGWTSENFKLKIHPVRPHLKKPQTLANRLLLFLRVGGYFCDHPPNKTTLS